MQHAAARERRAYTPRHRSFLCVCFLLLLCFLLPSRYPSLPSFVCMCACVCEGSSPSLTYFEKSPIQPLTPFALRFPFFFFLSFFCFLLLSKTKQKILILHYATSASARLVNGFGGGGFVRSSRGGGLRCGFSHCGGKIRNSTKRRIVNTEHHITINRTHA